MTSVVSGLLPCMDTLPMTRYMSTLNYFRSAYCSRARCNVFGAHTLAGPSVPQTSGHLSCMDTFACSHGRPFMTGTTVVTFTIYLFMYLYDFYFFYQSISFLVLCKALWLARKLHYIIFIIIYYYYSCWQSYRRSTPAYNHKNIYPSLFTC